MKFFIYFFIVCASIHACDGEDFAHFHNRMYKEAIECNIMMAEKYLYVRDYPKAYECYLTAKNQYELLTFPNEKLKLKIDAGLSATEPFILD